ncbi:MAG: 3'-5' exoribonuclease YhaM family protein [Thermoguttaceae bacterium]
MSRLFVNQIKENDAISDIYRVQDKVFRTDKRGACYLQLVLCDKTGSLTAFLWNTTEEESKKFDEGDFVRCEGRGQLYQGKLQAHLTKIKKVEMSEVAGEHFAQTTRQDLTRLAARLREMLDTVTSPDLRLVVDAFLNDHELMERFKRVFAGLRIHHANLGGLLEHTVAMMELSEFVGRQYCEIVDREILLVGAFLHDIGKTEELSDDPVAPAYTDDGQALGHPYLGAELLDRKLVELKAAGKTVDPIIALKLKHMILSHHGVLEFGAVKLPMTREAIALHLIDALDAKLNEFQKFIQEDVNRDKAWTSYNPALERKLLK